MFEREILIAGFGMGYILLWVIMACISLIWYVIEQRRIERFMTEYRLHDRYNRWKENQKTLRSRL